MATSYDTQTRLWHGPYRPPVLNPAANLGPVLLNVLERTPHKVAQVNADRNVEMTCNELRRRSVRFANYLTTCGFEKGDVLALVARNSDNVAPIAFGCFLAGVTINTLDPSFTKTEIAHVLRLTRPRMVVADHDVLEVVRQAAIQCKLSFDRRFGVLQQEDKPCDSDCCSIDVLLRFPINGRESDEDNYVPAYLGDSTKLIAAIVCSSGTTGLPKAVRISHAQLIAPYQRVTQLDREDTILCFSTLYWISGLQMLLTGVLNGIRRVITTRPGTPDHAIELCKRYSVTLMLVTPTLASDILRALGPSDRLLSLKWFAVGGSIVPMGLRNAINQRAVVSGRGRCFVGYGTSETGNIAYDLVPCNDSVGFLLPGVTAKILDENGQSLGPLEAGELLIRPAYPFLGYHGDDSATNETLDKEGFVRTGDIARFDKDGFLYLLDRRREILKYNGFQIAPAQLEAIIGELEGVRHVVVVGLTDSERVYNDLATALIVRTSDEPGLDEQKVIEHCIYDSDGKRRPEHLKLRGGVIFVEQLPMTVNGKVQRGAAKRLAMEYRATNQQ